MATRRTQVVVISILAVVVIVVAGFIGWRYFAPKDPANFTECTQSAGSALQETYPEVCRTKSGKQFTNPDQKVE